MKDTYNTAKGASSFVRFEAAVFCLLILIAAAGASERDRRLSEIKRVPSPRGTLNLEEIPYKIVYETYRRTRGASNWELFMMNADGSGKVNLTDTPDLDEMYPHVSPDATKISFVVDQGSGRKKVRSVYYMNIDGSDRTRVARNARQPCWDPNSKRIAYLKGEYERYSDREYATADLLIYDIETGEHKLHPNEELDHIYALCWSPDAKWFLCAVQGGVRYSDTILAVEADGMKVFDLEKWGVKGCRPDVSPDGKLLAWGETDWEMRLGDLDLNAPDGPRVDNVRYNFGCVEAAKIYHFDISPDGKYLAFSYGPDEGGQQVGGMARGWNICIADLNGTWVKVTTDGRHNKEPDWVPIPSLAPRTAEDKEEDSPIERILSHPLVQKDN